MRGMGEGSDQWEVISEQRGMGGRKVPSDPFFALGGYEGQGSDQ
jgi:hypothetical protein